MDNKNISRVLVVDDDTEICELLKDYLEKQQLHVETVQSGNMLFNLYPTLNFDIIVLDVMMPGDDGFEICRKIRHNSQIPIIMLTAGSDETDRIIGLELGADDYMSKPFNPRELLARIKAVLRRTETPTIESSNIQYHFGSWILNSESRTIRNEDAMEVPLNSSEYDLLLLFLKNPGHTFSRDELSTLIKGRESFPFDRSIDVQISRLRSRLNDGGKTPQLIKTIRGTGYILTAHVETVG